ncbi:MAG: hypothetical protein ACI3T9_05075 [Romboutsia timonensis]
MEIKKIIINKIDDEMLKNLLNFSIINCDKVIVEINKDITISDINNKILELNKIRHDLIELEANYEILDSIDKNNIPNKYLNDWIKIGFEEEGNTIEMNHEKLDKVINFLISIDYNYSIDNPSDYEIYWEDAVDNFIQDDFMLHYYIRKCLIPSCRYKTKFNEKYEVEYVYK